MAINVSPANLSGLAAIAGRRGSLNLPSPGALGLQSLQLKQQKEQAAKQAALKQQQIQAQELASLRQAQIQRQQLAQQAQQSQARGLLDSRKLQMQGQQFGQQQDLKQQQLQQQQDQFGRKQGFTEDTVKKEMAMKQLQMETKELAKKKASELNNMGAFATQASLAMGQVKNPSDARALQVSIIDEAMKNKYIPKAEGERLKKLPISTFKNQMQFKVLQLNRAKDFKALRPKDKSSGMLKFTDSSGNTVEYTPLTKPNQTSTQKELLYARDNLSELTGLINEVPENFFGPQASGQTLTQVREWVSGIPGLGKVDPSKGAKTQLETYSNYNGRLKMLAMQTIKQLSGVQYSDKQLEFMKEILPEIGVSASKSVFDGRAKNLVRYYKTIDAAKSKVLAKGIAFSKDPDSKFGREMLTELQNNKAAPSNDIRGQLISKGHSPEDVDAYLKGIRQ